MEKPGGLESLKVWRASLDFAVKVCKEILPLLPSEEKYSLSTQLRRSSQSVPANVAEGYGRYYFQENIRFCYVARGSLDEAYSQLTLAHELGYIYSELYQASLNEIQIIRRMLNGYISYLKESKPGANEPGASIHEAGTDYQIDELIEE